MSLAQKSLLLLVVWPSAIVVVATAWHLFHKQEREAALRRECVRLMGYRDDLLAIAEGAGVVPEPRTPLFDAIAHEFMREALADDERIYEWMEGKS